MKKDKTKKMTLRGKIVIIILMMIVLVVMISRIHKTIDDRIFNQIEQNEQYDLKISYQKTNIDALDRRVKEYIEDNKNEFLKHVKEKEKDDNKFDFVLDAQTRVFKDIYFVNTYCYFYIGGSHYERNDNTLIYNKNNNKFLDINDLVDANKFEELAGISKHLLKKVAIEKEIELDEEALNEGTIVNQQNYKNIYINDSGMNILFIPYQIASWADGEFNILIDWQNLNKIIKEEYIQSDIAKQEKIEIVQSKRDLSKYKDKKVIAFTFDDGPNNATTTKLLDGLSELDAKVTFFVLGSRVSNNAELIKRAYMEGNDIGSHTYSHRNLLKLNDKEIKDEINNTNDAIKNVIGVEPIYIRPPYGNTNEHIKSLTTMHTICWNIDSNDWRTKDRNKIKNQIVNDAKDGSIVLVHDIYEESVEGALLAMRELKKEGYEFVTISEMIQLKNATLDYDTTYYNF